MTPLRDPGSPKGVLLDLDDTILDDSETIEQCWRDACVAHCPARARVDPERLYVEIRKQGEWFWGDPERHRIGRLDLDAARAHVVRLALGELGIDEPSVAGQIARRYADARDANLHPIPNAIDAVRWLRSHGCKLAMLTNGAGRAQRSKIDRFDLAGLFDCILIEGEVGFGKPDARIYRRALEALEVEPGDAWMIGDHLEFDVAAPQRIGLFAVWIDARGQGVPAGRSIQPDLIIGTLSELQSGNIPCFNR